MGRMASLFSFGTLLDPAVQQHLFDTTLPTRAAELSGHAIVDVRITDPEVVAASGKEVHPGMVRSVHGSVPGGILDLDEAALQAADGYEVADYARRRVLTTQGEPVWAYLSANPLAVAERIAVVGDSIAYGRADTGGGWQAALSRWHLDRDEVQHRFYNLALPGTTLERIRGHVLTELQERRVDTALVSAGINDLMLDQCSPAAAVTRLQRLCEALEGVGIRPVVLGPTWFAVDASAQDHGVELTEAVVLDYRESVLRWAARTLRDVLDPWPVLEGRPELLTDHLHPDAAGHALLAQWILGRAQAAPDVFAAPVPAPA